MSRLAWRTNSGTRVGGEWPPINGEKTGEYRGNAEKIASAGNKAGVCAEVSPRAAETTARGAGAVTLCLQHAPLPPPFWQA